MGGRTCNVRCFCGFAGAIDLLPGVGCCSGCTGRASKSSVSCPSVTASKSLKSYMKAGCFAVTFFRLLLLSGVGGQIHLLGCCAQEMSQSQHEPRGESRFQVCSPRKDHLPAGSSSGPAPGRRAYSSRPKNTLVYSSSGCWASYHPRMRAPRPQSVRLLAPASFSSWGSPAPRIASCLSWYLSFSTRSSCCCPATRFLPLPQEDREFQPRG